MKQDKIPLYDVNLPRVVVRELSETIRSGWLSSGPRVKAFEHAVKGRAGVRYAAATNSATAGLIATLRAIDIKGREVITTPFSFVATVEAIVHAGGIPVMADIDPVTLNVSPDEVARHITPQTGCILPVDIAGFPAEYAALRRTARQHDLPIVADASHSFGAAIGGKPAAALADAAVLSFHVTKNLICGEGGMVLSRDRLLIEKVRILCNHGLSANAAERRQQGELTYDVTELGYKGTMSELHAAVGLGHITMFERNQARRRVLAERYLKNLSDLTEFVALPPVHEKVAPAWHLFIVKLQLSRLKIDRRKFIKLMASMGIECGLHFIPIFAFSYYRSLCPVPEALPNTVRAGHQVVTLPLYPSLTAAQVDRVCDAVRTIIKTHHR